MAAILLVAHAPQAAALLAVARHVYPDCSVGLAAVDIEPGAGPEEAQAQVRAALEALPEPEVLILADVFGASPCKAALAVADGTRARVVAGINVPMLWRVLCYAAQLPLDELVTRAVDGGVQGVMQVGVPRPQNQGPAPARNDQVQHHDQQ